MYVTRRRQILPGPCEYSQNFDFSTPNQLQSSVLNSFQQSSYFSLPIISYKDQKVQVVPRHKTILSAVAHNKGGRIGEKYKIDFTKTELHKTPNPLAYKNQISSLQIKQKSIGRNYSMNNLMIRDFK